MVRTIKLWVVTIMVILEGWFHDIGYGCLEHERQALLELRSSFNVPHARFLSSWGIEADCCSWYRVKCDQSTRRVIRLDLSSETDLISGDWYINASLFLRFEELSYLSLKARDIVGCVENEGFERLSKLVNLETLDLSFNKFNNSILPSLNHLPSLLNLDLTNNRLNGKIDPKDLNNLTNLEELDLGFNEIEGFKSVQGDEETLELSNLEFLDLSYNHFDNNVLSYLSGLPSLISLYINNNRIKGSIDVTELDALSQLQELNLGGNAITEFASSTDAKHGSTLVGLYLDSLTKNVTEVLLQSLSEFPNLGTLSLTSNNIVQGEISNRGFPYLKYLETLDLSFSILHDSVLKTMEKLTSLHSLNLRNCGLIGRAPQSLCELKHLQELDVGYNNLTGILPLYVANLTSLQRLDLSHNNFSGDISPLKSLTSIQSLSLSFNHFQIPMSLSPLLNLSTLKTLDVSGNEIYTETKEQVLAPKFQLQSLLLSSYGGGGTFPRFLYHQHDLHEVDLSHLKLRGRFPQWLLENNTDLQFLSLVNNSLSGPLKLPVQSQMNLSYLQISDNDLYGQIPKEMGLQFPMLRTLEMANNGLNGTIPSSFGNMTILQSLDLANNALSGELPEQLIKGCYSLRDLRLSNNSLQGQIFPRNATVTNLEWFRLDGNQFSGSIPNSLSKSSFLIVLVASHNNLSGTVPQWLRNMTILKVLDLSNNDMVGSLPPGFSPPNIEQVYLSNNRFQGSLKKAFHDCSKLMALEMSHNNFTGRIPKWFANCSQLSYLILKDNRFEGEIPVELCKLYELNLIDLSSNNLCGHILTCLRFSGKLDDKFDDLADPRNTSTLVRAEFTTKSISYSYIGKILVYMSGLDLSSNNLTGEIPQALGSLSMIKALNLSRNKLQGPIPPTFSNLQQVESLDLSYNRLEGNIPPQLPQLHYLSDFSVAHNNLSGRTPDMVAQFATFDKSGYEGNPFLCGPPLPNSCDAGSPSQNATKYQEDNDFLDMNAFYGSFGASYLMALLGIAAVLYINPYWKQVWFHYVEVVINSCRCFVVDNLLVMPKFRFS